MFGSNDPMREPDVAQAERPLDLLLVEDDGYDRETFRRVLDRVGFLARITEAVDLRTAREALSSHRFDCLVVDLRLPDGSGEALIGATSPQGDPLPVLILTGLDDESLGLDAVSKGAQDYLVKGDVEPGHMVRSIRYAIRRQQVRQARGLTSEPAMACDIAVNLNGAAGPEAVLRQGPVVHRVTSANRAVLLYLLANRRLEERQQGLTDGDAGWCSDREVTIGIWGRMDEEAARNRLRVLVHRMRKRLMDVGLTDEILETRRSAIRGHFGNIDIR